MLPHCLSNTRHQQPYLGEAPLNYQTISHTPLWATYIPTTTPAPLPTNQPTKHLTDSPHWSSPHACVDLNQPRPSAGVLALNMEHTQLEAKSLNSTQMVWCVVSVCVTGGGWNVDIRTRTNEPASMSAFSKLCKSHSFLNPASHTLTHVVISLTHSP